MVRSLVFDHTDHSITYSGRWIVFPAVHLTGEQNASATFDFNGSSVSVTGSIGIVSEDVPLLSYALDGEDNGLHIFDSEHPHILYSSSPLQEGHHVLSLTLLTNASVLSIEGILITTNDVETGSSLHILWTRHRLGIIGIACGILVLVLIVFLALFVYFRRRKRDVVYNSKGPLQVALPTTKEAFTARNCSTYGLTFLPYDPGSDNFIQLPPKKARPRPKICDDPSPPSMSGITMAQFSA